MKKIIVSLLIAVLAMVGCVSLVACKNDKIIIGVQSGTTGELYVKGDADMAFNGFSNAQAKGYPSGVLATKDMLNGVVDFVVLDIEPAKSLVESQKNDLKLIDIKLTNEIYAIGVDKAQPELLTKINTFLAKVKANGVLEGIFDKYDDENYAPVGVTAGTYDSKKEQLVLSTNAEFEPFEYKSGDKFFGIDMELAKLMADEFGMELVIKDMQFDSVVTSVGKNGIDIAMAGLTIKESRKKSVQFSDGYFMESYQVIVCQKNDTTFDGLTTAAQVVEKIASLKK